MRRELAIVALTLFAGHAINAGRAQSGEQGKEIWGEPFQGLSISLRPGKAQFRLGERIDVLMRVKNAGDQPLTLVSSGRWRTSRIAVFYADGRPVPKTHQLKEVEASIANPTVGRISTTIRELAPGEVPLAQSRLTLNPWFQVDREGTYLVLVMYSLGSWDKGFAVSNLAKFRIMNGDDTADSPDQPSKADRDKEQ